MKRLIFLASLSFILNSCSDDDRNPILKGAYQRKEISSSEVTEAASKYLETKEVQTTLKDMQSFPELPIKINPSVDAEIPGSSTEATEKARINNNARRDVVIALLKRQSDIMKEYLSRPTDEVGNVGDELVEVISCLYLVGPDVAYPLSTGLEDAVISTPDRVLKAIEVMSIMPTLVDADEEKELCPGVDLSTVVPKAEDREEQLEVLKGLRRRSVYVDVKKPLNIPKSTTNLCGPGHTRIYFGNGVLTSFESALHSWFTMMNYIYMRIDGSDNAVTWIFGSRYHPKLAYNTNENIIDQALETIGQKVNSLFGVDLPSFWAVLHGRKEHHSMLDAVRELQAKHLEKYLYKDLEVHVNKYAQQLKADYNVLLVAHSQGNFYANAAYDLLEREYRSPTFNAQFRIIGLGSPAERMKSDFPYINLKDDHVITNVPASLPPNLQNPNHSWLGHYFIDDFLEGMASGPKFLELVLESVLVKGRRPLETTSPLPIEYRLELTRQNTFRYLDPSLWPFFSFTSNAMKKGSYTKLTKAQCAAGWLAGWVTEIPRTEACSNRSLFYIEKRFQDCETKNWKGEGCELFVDPFEATSSKDTVVGALRNECRWENYRAFQELIDNGTFKEGLRILKQTFFEKNLH